MSGTSEGRHRRVPLWLWPNLLSLDAPAVALAWQWLFHRTWKIPLPFDFQVILATAVWLIYVLDRYLDARGRPADSDWTPRHHFYHQTGGILLGVALVAGAALVTFVWIRLPLAIFEAGMVLGGIVLAHLLTAQCQSRIFDGTGLKEICVATLFMFGVNLDLWLAPPSQSAGFHLACAELVAACAMNCLLIREWEGDCRAEALWKLCLLPLGALLALVLLWKDCPGMTACLAISQLALAGLALGGHCWSVNVRRAVVDLVLLTPLLALVA